MRALTIAALLLVGCQTPADPPPVPGTLAEQGEPVLVVNGEPITQDMIDAVTMRIPPDQLEHMASIPGQMERFHEQLAMGQLLYKRALEAGLHQDPAIQAGLAMTAREFLAGMYVTQQSDAAVTEEAVQEFYQDRAVQFGQPQVKARHILVERESLANDLMKQIEGGADFAELARQHSADHGSARTGGDLGWFEQGRMVEEFSNAAFSAEKGEVVGPVQTRFGFHLIEVQDKRDKIPLEEVRNQIVSSIREKAVQDLLEGIRHDMNLERVAEAPAAPGDAPAAAEATAAGSSEATP